MKKILFLTTLLCLSLFSVAQVKVQGIMRNDIQRAPAQLLDDASTFTFDDIQNWSGEGANKAMMVIQWNVDGETNAMAFGYRWDGTAYGIDMIDAIVTNNPRLYFLTMGGTSYGSVIAGFGWDVDGNGDIALILNGNSIEPDENGIFTTTSYNNFDNYSAADATDYWGSGWYSSYWSYYTKSTVTASWSYASTGASGRKLVDGCCDGWNFARGMGSYSWKPIVSAPSLIPDDAQREFIIDGICYTLKGWSDAHKTVMVSAPFEGSNIEYQGNITIPASFQVDDITYEVVGVDDNAFANTPSLSSVVLPESATNLGNSAFQNSAINSVTYTSSLKKMGENVFNGCSNLTSIMLPEAISTIPAGAFAGTGVTSLVVPEYITAIGDNAFNGSQLTTLEINPSVTNIGAGAFAGCPITAVKSMSLTPATCGEEAFDAATCNSAILTVPAGYIDVYKAANVWKDFINFNEVAAPVYVGDIFAKMGVNYKVIANDADCQEVVVTYATPTANTASAIQTANRAFYTEAINIPATVNHQNVMFNVVAIADSAFYGANTLPSVTIEDGMMRSIGKNAFFSCNNSSFTSLVIPQSVTSIAPQAFRSANKLTSVTLPSNMTEIPDSLFMSCSALEAIDIPAGVTRIGNYAFYYCSKLASATMPTALEKVGEYALYGTALPQINLPETVNEIGKYAFAVNKALTSFNWPEAVTTIPDCAFWGCSGLQSINIPSTVNSIGIEVFKGCTVLQDVELPASVTEWPQGTFYNCKAIIEMEIPEGVTTLGKDVFNSCSGLTTVIFPNSLTSIGEGAFTSCNAITEIQLPERFTVIPDKLFMNCLGLETVHISSQATKIGKQSFDGCKALVNLNLPESLDTIGDIAFRNCSNLIVLPLPQNLTYLGQSSLSGILTIDEVVFPENVEVLQPYVFQNCTNLKKVTGLGRFEDVPNYLFAGCTTLDSIDFEPKLKTIGANAFNKCTSLPSFDFGDKLISIGSSALAYDTNFTDVVLSPVLTSLGNSNFYYHDSVMVWSTMEQPLNLTSRYALCTQSGTAYANVTVLNGTKAVYEEANIWKDCTLRELEISGMDVVEDEETHVSASSATLVLNPQLTYAQEESVPATFQKYNSKHAMASVSKFVIEYFETDDNSKKGRVVATADAVIDENGILTANIDGLKSATAYTYRVKALDENDNVVYTSSDNYFTTDGVTVIESLVIDDSVVDVKYYNTLGVQSDKPIKGINIIVVTYDDGSVKSFKHVF